MDNTIFQMSLFTNGDIKIFSEKWNDKCHPFYFGAPGFDQIFLPSPAHSFHEHPNPNFSQGAACVNLLCHFSIVLFHD